MTTAQTATAEPTYDDLSAAVDRLAKQVADLTAQLSETQEHLDDARTELRRTRDICRDLAVEKWARELQIDRDQHSPAPQPEPPRKKHWCRPKRKRGNQT